MKHLEELEKEYDKRMRSVVVIAVIVGLLAGAFVFVLLTNRCG